MVHDHRIWNDHIVTIFVMALCMHVTVAVWVRRNNLLKWWRSQDQICLDKISLHFPNSPHNSKSEDLFQVLKWNQSFLEMDTTHFSVCCCVLFTWGWGRLETRPPVALGSSQGLFAFTMSLALPVHLSPIFLTDTENLWDPVQFQQGHAQDQFSILGEVS